MCSTKVMLTDTNSSNLVQTEVHTVVSCSDLQTGHLRPAAYNLAFFSLLGFFDEDFAFPTENTLTSTKPHCQRSGYAGTKKSIGLPGQDIAVVLR